jgi:phosphodiesterase/alkaline phosphatase D-like protein
VDEARFAVVSCSNYPFGYFNVYDQIARREDFDAVLHLGDYIYEYGPDGYGGEDGARLNRPHDPAHEIVTLADYRRRYAQYKADPASQAMHAAHPLIAIWDDHETSNNSWADGAENHDPQTEGDWAERKRAALQAYYEWMPIRDPEPGRLREAIFRSFSFGDLLTLAAIETRLMARTEPLNFNDFGPTLKSKEDADAFRREVLSDPARELLGQEQLAFLDGLFRKSVTAGQPWRLIANQIIMAETNAPDLSPHVDEAGIQELEKLWDQARAFVEASKLGLPTNLDAWDGYPAARERFYDMVKAAGRDGLIVVTGDTHTWWANDLVAKDGVKMGVELGVHSVTSPSPYRKAFLGGRGERYALLTNQENKAVRYLNGEDHGYIDLLIRRGDAEAKFMAVDTVETPAYAAFEKASFKIRRGGGAAKFAGVGGVTMKERFLFG